MKILLHLFTFLLLVVYGYAQPGKSPVLKKSTKAAFDSCKKVPYLVKILPQKRHGKLIIPVKNKKAITFIDDPEFEEYYYIGTIKKTTFVLVRLDEPNEETFYLINQSTGVMDTLIGPLFLQATNPALFASTIPELMYHK